MYLIICIDSWWNILVTGISRNRSVRYGSSKSVGLNDGDLVFGTRTCSSLGCDGRPCRGQWLPRLRPLPAIPRPNQTAQLWCPHFGYMGGETTESWRSVAAMARRDWVVSCNESMLVIMPSNYVPLCRDQVDTLVCNDVLYKYLLMYYTKACRWSEY